MIERKILIGLITNTDFLRQIEDEWNPNYMVSKVGREISDWCWEYYRKYKAAPMREIETIYMKKLKAKKLTKEVAEEIESELLPALNEEYEQEPNLKTLLDDAREFFNEQQIQMHIDELSNLLGKGRITEAVKKVEEFKVKTQIEDSTLDLCSPLAIKKLEEAFDKSNEPVVRFPGALGDFWNDQLVRGALVGILAPEKRGKCLPATQKVLTSTGEYVSIAELVQSKRRDIISYDEENRCFVKTNISDFWENGIKPVYEVKTKTGRTVQTTFNHPFLTPDGWKDLSEIKTGEFIATPKELPIFGDLKISKTTIKLLAYLLADGCLREYTYNGVVTKTLYFTKKLESVQKDFTTCVERFNCSVSWNDAISCSIINSEKNRNKHDKNNVLKMANRFGIWNKKSVDKTIPKEIFQTTKENTALFLRVLFTCDGWVNKTGEEIGYCSANKEFAKQVQFLLTKFGIVSSLLETKNEFNGAWSVSIGDYENMQKYADSIGFLFEKQEILEMVLASKNKKYRSFLDKFPYQVAKKFHDEVKEELGYSNFLKAFKKAPTVREQIVKKCPLMRQSFLEVKNTDTGKKYFDSQLLWDEVISIKLIGNRKTYDLTVNKHHNFIAENVLVHNTFLLLEFMMRAFSQGKKVAFFQAGDMTEAQQNMRIAIYLAKRSNKEKYCGIHYLPVQDCIKNQKDTCTKRVRECSFGLFGEEVGTRNDITKEALVEAFELNPDYKPCFNCKEWLIESNHWGTPWLEKINIKDALTKQTAVKHWKKFFNKAENLVKLATFANGELNTKLIEKTLENWQEKHDFKPDLVLVDYGDLLTPEIGGDFRHQENDKWKKLRGLSQKTDALWVVPTQADAESYKKEVLDMTNYSEDKRKNAHVTALYGLNQDPKGREKEIGIVRINKIVIREGEFHSSQQVNVLQKLSIGRPFLGSYF